VFEVRIVVLGCGNIGSVAAQDLAESLSSAEVVMSDVNKSRAEEVASRITLENVSWIQADASNHLELVNTLKKFDLAVGALPGWMGYRTCKAAIAAKVDIVDVSYMPEDVMTLNKDAVKAKVSVVPDCGMSPGLGSVLVGRAVSKLDQVESVHMFNGGLPEKPVPPLSYVITWSVKDLIDMYSRKVHIVRDGKAVQVEPMSGLEEIKFPRVGKLEAFYTDGLRTLLHTVKGATDMWEKSLRYPGHVEKIKLLKGLGFFDEKPVKIDSFQVAPREVTAQLFEKKLKRPEVPDVVAMRIEVSGMKDGKRVNYAYHVLDRYDKKRRVTSMARTTAYTCSVVAQLLARKAMEDKGVVPPEKLGMNERLYKKFMNLMKKRRIAVKESKKTLH
jgi:saccharopine dehydrogenase-like NADP-dependent oxidoreductase